jgi:signal transduction histidine kinase
LLKNQEQELKEIAQSQTGDAQKYKAQQQEEMNRMASLNSDLIERMQRDHKARTEELTKQIQNHTIQKLVHSFDKILRDTVQSKVGF